jgi:hypothetical protein
MKALKRQRFMAERERWHNWRSGAGADDQKLQWHNFYTYLRSQIALDVDNYDFRIQVILASWRFIAFRSQIDSSTPPYDLGVQSIFS